jgi:hypothetical protein
MLDRERFGVAQGQYSRIDRESWQPITFQAGVLVPVGQASVIAFSCGLVVTICAMILCHVARWPVKYGALAGALSWSVLLAWRSVEAINWTRSAYLAKEHYTAEKQQGAQADKTVVSLQWTDTQANGRFGRTVYEDLSVSPEQLALVVQADRLSKRGLMDSGLNDVQSMRLLAQLLTFGYILRKADNLPAEWTSKGQALRKTVGSGGGGGGGGVVVDCSTTSKNGMG